MRAREPEGFSQGLLSGHAVGVEEQRMLRGELSSVAFLQRLLRALLDGISARAAFEDWNLPEHVFSIHDSLSVCLTGKQVAGADGADVAERLPGERVLIVRPEARDAGQQPRHRPLV
jgi:hypothetical protein